MQSNFQFPLKSNSSFRVFYCATAIAALVILSILFSFGSIAVYSASQRTNSTPTAEINLSSDSPASATYPMIVSAGSHVYVAWSEAAGGIKFRSSANYGVTWNPTFTLSNMSSPYGAVQFPIMYANNSNVYVTWSQDYGSLGAEIFEATSLNNGSTFNIAQLTFTNGKGTTTPGGYITPAIAASGSNVYVTFTGNGSNAYVMSSTDDGSSWGAPHLYSHSLEDEVAAWGNSAYAIADHGVAGSFNDGQTWKTLLSNSTFHGDEPMIAVYGQNVYVADELPNGSSRADSYIHVYISNSAGTPKMKFRVLQDLSVGQNDSWAPMVAAFGNDAWIASRSYPGGAKGTIWEYTTTDAGKIWTSALALSGNGSNFNTKGTAETFPFEVATTDGQNVFVGWAHQVKAGYWRFMVSGTSNAGASWTAAPGINMSGNTKGEAGFENDLAVAAISSSGPYCYAVWQYRVGSTNQIYFASVII